MLAKTLTDKEAPLLEGNRFLQYFKTLAAKKYDLTFKASVIIDNFFQMQPYPNNKKAIWHGGEIVPRGGGRLEKNRLIPLETRTKWFLKEVATELEQLIDAGREVIILHKHIEKGNVAEQLIQSVFPLPDGKTNSRDLSVSWKISTPVTGMALTTMCLNIRLIVSPEVGKSSSPSVIVSHLIVSLDKQLARKFAAAIVDTNANYLCPSNVSRYRKVAIELSKINPLNREVEDHQLTSVHISVQLGTFKPRYTIANDSKVINILNHLCVLDENK